MPGSMLHRVRQRKHNLEVQKHKKKTQKRFHFLLELMKKAVFKPKKTARCRLCKRQMLETDLGSIISNGTQTEWRRNGTPTEFGSSYERMDYDICKACADLVINF